MLQIRLLGQFDVRQEGKRILISSRAGQSLLAYLAMTAGTHHRREKLAGTLWPESSDENARKNLRQELWRIRKAIPNQGLTAANNYLLSDEYTITFNPDAEYWLDVAILERPDLDPQSLTSSLSLYQGELLPGFYDDWVVFERERIQSLFESKMERLVETLVEAERWTVVQEQCERWLALGFASEPAYRGLMLAHSARGDMAKVSAIYQRCVDDLHEQFGVEPSAETHALYNGLLKGARAPRRAVTAQLSSTVTFMFTDIQASTRLLDKLGEQYAAALAEHHKILRRSIQKWRGSEMDTQGDAFFVTFHRALDAVQCAAEAQRALASHSWPLDEPLRVRMGLHTGEPLIGSTGYVGMDVHRAARIGDAGHGGQVLLSQTTRDLVMHDLPAGLAIRDMGEHRLKDMKFPTPIYQLDIEGLQSDFPSLKTKFTGTEAPAPGEPPFKGLQYFEEADADLFFGRELLTARLVNRLHETRFLSVIIGASGSGKSSLVRAGLIPVLRKGRTLLDGTKPPAGSQDWQVHIITPTAHPLEALATELTRDLDSVATTARLIDDLAQEPRSLALFFARERSRRYTVLVIDQFEELFTLCHDEFEREAFIDNLLNLVSVDQSKATLIITLRADFYAHLAQYPELRAAVAHQQEYIGPMNVEELRRAIEEPAKRGYWEFEPGLVDLILRDVGDEPGALPLLSHALLETWKRRAGYTLTLKGYADAGGVHGAIAHTAESIYQNLSSAEQSIALDIFLRLTELGEGTEDTRRRVSYAELNSSSEDAKQVRRVLNKLADARLITLGENTVEVAHEALIREWPTLREWLNQDREGLRLHRHLTEAAYEWELLGHDLGALYRGAHLAQAQEWADLHPKALNAAERLFLNTSIEQEQREERERQEQQQRELEAAQKLAETEKARAEEQAHSANRLRTRNRVITTIGSIAVILALLAGMFGIRSNQNAVQAKANFNRAEAQRMALEANRLLTAGGSPEQIALLSLQSMETHYTPEGDAALAAAARLDYPIQILTHSTTIRDVDLSPDGKYVLTASFDKTAGLWDAQSGKELHRFTSSDPVWKVAFSPDGKYILGMSSKSAIVWDARTFEEIHHFKNDKGLSTVAYSHDGKYIFISSWDYTVSRWDAESGKEAGVLIKTQAPDVVASISISPDGKFILTGSSAARLWDIQTGQELREFLSDESSVQATAFSADGNFVLTGNTDGKAHLWNLSTGEVMQTFIGHTSNILSVAFTPDNKSVITSGFDNTIRLWDIQTGQELRRFICPAFVGGIDVSPDGGFVLSGSGDGKARIWSLKSSPPLPEFTHGKVISALAFSSDGRLILTGGSGGIVSLWNAETGEKMLDFVGHTDTINYGVTFSPDGKYVATASWDATLRLWDTQTGDELHQFNNQSNGINSVVFSPDGRYLLTAADDGVKLLDVKTGQLIRQFGDITITQRAAFSPDGRFILTAASGVNDGKARLWDVSTGQLIREYQSNLGSMSSVAFSPDGKYVLATGVDMIVHVWETQTGKELHQLIGHTDEIWTATFSPDGKFIATASADRTARMWDVQTGQELRRFIGHTAGVENVVFSPDGKYVLTGSDDGTARLWDVDYHTTMDYLCSRLLRDFTDEERAQYGITGTAPTCPAQ